jgi:hypothetical protein
VGKGRGGCVGAAPGPLSGRAPGVHMTLDDGPRGSRVNRHFFFCIDKTRFKSPSVFWLLAAYLGRLFFALPRPCEASITQHRATDIGGSRLKEPVDLLMNAMQTISALRQFQAQYSDFPIPLALPPLALPAVSKSTASSTAEKRLCRSSQTTTASSSAKDIHLTSKMG